MISPTSRRQHGFTLVESLVVMFTIILLASIIIPGLMGRGSREPELPPVTIEKEVGAKPVTPPAETGAGNAGAGAAGVEEREPEDGGVPAPTPPDPDPATGE